MPALLLTTVKFLRSDRSRSALMRVFGTPEKPKPPTKTVESDFMSLIASCADETILLIAGRDVLAEKKRMPVAGPRRRAEKRRDRCIVEVLVAKWYKKGGRARKSQFSECAQDGVELLAMLFDCLEISTKAAAAPRSVSSVSASLIVKRRVRKYSFGTSGAEMTLPTLVPRGHPSS